MYIKKQDVCFGCPCFNQIGSYCNLTEHENGKPCDTVLPDCPLPLSSFPKSHRGCATVLIRDFNIPENCKDCPCREIGEFSSESDWCCLNEENIDNKEIISSKCPLVQLPPHGDLIDIEDLKSLLLHMWTKNENYTISDIFRELPDLPVIVDAVVAEDK